jgi:hypothetical protein
MCAEFYNNGVGVLNLVILWQILQYNGRNAILWKIR